jgi:C_GCAxxG_C_C family probable redox protein
MEESSIKTSVEKLITVIGAKAYDLFTTGRLWCSEAVLVTLNQGLGGGLSRRTAEALTVGMGSGLGGSGCLCGAVNGAVVGLGLFLAGCDASKRINAKAIRAHAKYLEKAFRSRFGATCCRILMKKNSKNQRCAEQTAFAAEVAASIILHRRPELLKSADFNFLNQHQSRVTTFLKKIVSQR